MSYEQHTMNYKQAYESLVKEVSEFFSSTGYDKYEKEFTSIVGIIGGMSRDHQMGLMPFAKFWNFYNKILHTRLDDANHKTATVTNIPDRDAKLAFITNQIEVHKLYAQHWLAVVNSGVAVLRDIKQGREVTQEEKDNGQSIGWRDLTDAEKNKRALQSASSHIRQVSACSEVQNALIRDDLEAYEFSCNIVGLK